MGEIWDGLVAGFWLVVTLDADLVEITLRSLYVTLTAVVIAWARGLRSGGSGTGGRPLRC